MKIKKPVTLLNELLKLGFISTTRGFMMPVQRHSKKCAIGITIIKHLALKTVSSEPLSVYQGSLQIYRTPLL